jgi:biopolymer transport protein ExbD
MRRFGNADSRAPISDINVTPLVDVTLVLLIIFMLVAPMIEVGINVDLPQAPTKQMDMPQSVNITIRSDGDVFMDGRQVSLEELERDLSRVAAANPEIGVIVKADQEITHGEWVEVVATIQEAGVTHLGIATKPIQSLSR